MALVKNLRNGSIRSNAGTIESDGPDNAGTTPVRFGAFEVAIVRYDQSS